MQSNRHQIVAFNAAAALGSFTAAARSLGVTQSAITQHIVKLERATGARLFERRQSGLDLTRAGRRLYEVTEEIGYLFKLLDERISEYARLDSGVLRIAATATRPTMEYMRRFRTNYPNVRLVFIHAGWRECARLLQNREVDIAIMPQPEKQQRMSIKRIGQRRHDAIVCRDHPLSVRGEVSLHELARFPLVIGSVRSFARHRLEAAMELHDVTFADTMHVAASSTAIEAVAHGLGVTVGYPDPQLLPDALCAVPITELSERYWIVAACPHDNRDLTLVKRLIDVID